MSCWRASIRRPKSSANVYIRQRRRRPSKHSLHASGDVDVAQRQDPLHYRCFARHRARDRAAPATAPISRSRPRPTAHPKLEGTIHSAAEAIEQAGGQALPLVVDVRDEAAVKGAIAQTVARFGSLDIVVNNASAISLTPVAQTDMKRFDLMHQINARGTFMVSKYAIAHLERA